MAQYVAINEGDIRSIVRSASFSSSYHRDLAESALMIVMRDRRNGGKVDIGYFSEALNDLTRNLLSDSSAGRVMRKIEEMYSEQQESQKNAA